MNPYISLHAHVSNGSVGDSLIKIDDYIDKAKEMNLPALAVTDHGSMSAVYEFYHACKRASIKPIMGCEVYEAHDRLIKTKESERFHLVLIAKNNTGFKNLLKIVTDASTTGFYSKPRTDMHFMKEHGEGIICLSACVGGKLPKAILNNEDDSVLIKMIEEYKEAFDDFYLELQPGRFLAQYQVNAKLIELSKKTGTPLIVTNDVHYLNHEDYIPHDAHVKISRKKKFDSPQVYVDDIYYMMDRRELVDAFCGNVPCETLECAIDNAYSVAQCVEVSLPEDTIMPKVNDILTPADYEIEHRCMAKLEEISDNVNINQYTDRLITELDVIRQLGFSDYFLVVQDFIRHAKDSDIPIGPGRGSVCGSLAAYLMEITVVDPIKYNLLFERFLSPNRKAIPDIDLDFSSEQRAEMFEYVVEKYGRNHCALVSTVSMRKSKGAIRDIARILDIDKSTADYAAKLIPAVHYDDDGEKQTDLSIRDAVEVVPELRKLANKYPTWFRMADRLSGIPSSKSLHAAGILLSPQDLTNSIPMVRSNNDNIMATSLTLEDAESAGFVKFDFLSLASLSVYNNTMKDVGFKFDYLTNEYDDEKTWDLIGSKHTTGLFQISSKIYKQRMGKLKPRSIEELAACLALLRGPCISIGADKDYMDIIAGKKEAEYIHELYWDVTKDTHGITLYQEQIMQLAVNFGFTLEEGYDLMKKVAKKKPDLIRGYKERFYELGKEKGVPTHAINRIWHIIEVAGQYCFNKSHAVAYAILCYVSGYLKAHYPLHFFKNLLTNAAVHDKTEELTNAIADCRRHGFKFLPADINKSLWDFDIDNGKIRVGLSVIKGFGLKAYESFNLSRMDGPFKDMNDFDNRIVRSECNKGAITSLIFGDAFHTFFSSPVEAYTYFMTNIQKCDVPEEVKINPVKIDLAETSEQEIEQLILKGKFTKTPINNMEPYEWSSMGDSEVVNVFGLVEKTKRHKDDNERPYMVLNVASGDGAMEFTALESELATYKKRLRKNCWNEFIVIKQGLNVGRILSVEEWKK